MNSIPRSTLIGLIGALLGYGLRAYRDPIVPFFEITSIDVVGYRPDPYELDRTVADKLIGSLYIGPFPMGPGPRVHTNNGEIYDRWERSYELQRLWPEIRTTLEQLRTLETQTEYLTALSALLGRRSFERFLLTALEHARIQAPSVPGGQELVDATYDSEKYGGSYWLSFPDGTRRNLGEDLSNVSRRNALEPFISLTRFGQRPLLDTVFNDLISTYDKEYDIAISVVEALQSAKDQVNRWAFTVYFFNLANTPLLIETAIKLEVKDGRVRLLLPCRLLTVTDTEYTEKNEPIVVGPNSSALFGFMTLRSQKDMGMDGSALASIYQAGEGICRALIQIRTAGPSKTTTIRSGDTQFVKQKDPR